MVDLTRRFFLGGALSAVVIASVPCKGLANTPVIYANGIGDDTVGLFALLHGDPVHIPADKIEITSYKDVILHSGKYLISETIEVPRSCSLIMEAACFTASDRLSIDDPFFRVAFDDLENFFGKGISYTVQKDNGKFRSFWVDVSHRPGLRKTGGSRQIRN